jgi:hypothetical protein
MSSSGWFGVTLAPRHAHAGGRNKALGYAKSPHHQTGNADNVLGVPPSRTPSFSFRTLARAVAITHDYLTNATPYQ